MPKTFFLRLTPPCCRLGELPAENKVVVIVVVAVVVVDEDVVDDFPVLYRLVADSGSFQLRTKEETEAAHDLLSLSRSLPPLPCPGISCVVCVCVLLCPGISWKTCPDILIKILLQALPSR